MLTALSTIFSKPGRIVVRKGREQILALVATVHVDPNPVRENDEGIWLGIQKLWVTKSDFDEAKLAQSPSDTTDLYLDSVDALRAMTGERFRFAVLRSDLMNAIAA